MSRVFSLLALVIFFSGCAVLNQPKFAQKKFDEEDYYILAALEMQRIQNFQAASDLYEKLYEISQNSEYLYSSLNSDMMANDSKKVVQRVEKLPYDSKLLRLKTLAYLNLEDYDKARETALELSSKTKEADDYILVAQTYIKQNDNTNALLYLDKAYMVGFDENILDKISIILYINMGLKKDAIMKLETHSRIYGCSSAICLRLASFYSDQNNADGMLSAYTRLYEKEPTKELSTQIIQLYAYTKNFKKLEEFLVSSGSNDEILLGYYAQEKEYQKAKLIAKKLYDTTGDIEFLAQNAIFEYESSEDKKDKSMQDSVIQKLNKVLESSRKGVYLNYLGYLLIDNDIDINRGITLVKEALKLEEDSAYYLDSLAWGYYKLKKCKEAKKLIDRVIKLGAGENDEVKEHVEAINNCIKGAK